MREIIRSYIEQHTGVDNIKDETQIFQEGVVNSLFAIELMVFIEKNFGVRVTVSDLEMDNFSSIESIANFVSLKSSPKEEVV
jgi:methoxymalonate biosynthesis acyl carrier protein